MRPFIVVLLIISASHCCNAQANKPAFTYDDFERQIIDYQPGQNNLPEKDYNHGVMILNETKKNVKGDPKNFNRADYFNILSAFLSLKEKKETIMIAFEKFRHSEGSCEYFLSKGMFKYSKYDIIRAEIDKQISVCESTGSNDPDPFDMKEYSEKNGLDLNLVDLISRISESDKKYRKKEKTDWTRQTPIDKENQRIIDSLFAVHQSYIGKTLVGEKHKNVMWAVIQHSNVEMMDKYLPTVQQAVQDKEIGAVPLKMLIDRYYGLKHGYQVFGTQVGFGFELADDKKRKEIEAKYEIR